MVYNMDTMKTPLFSLAVVCTVLACGATEWHVYSTPVNDATGVQQMTNAFKQAKSGDVITIHAGTYNMTDPKEMMDPYFTAAGQTEYGENGTCYYSTVANLTVQGDPACTPDQVVLSGLGTNTGNYGYRRPLHLTADNCVVRNLKIVHGNCNYKRYMDGRDRGYDFRRGGGLMFGKSTSIVSNCVFSYCYAGQGAAVVNGSMIDCTFENSLSAAVALWPTRISGCTFEGGNGAIWNGSGPVEDCTFNGCKSGGDCTAVVDVSGAKSGGAYVPPVIRGCTFASCTAMCLKAPTGVGGEVSGCTFTNNNNGNAIGVASCLTNFIGTVSNCTFTGHFDFLADCTDVQACTFNSDGTTWAGKFDSVTSTVLADVTPVRRCALERCSFNAFNIRWGSVTIDPISIRNCLFRDNVMWGCGFAGLWEFTPDVTRDVEIASCTVVSNQSNATIGFVDGINCKLYFKNVLFHDNISGGQNRGWCDFFNLSPAVAASTFSNCVVRAANGSRQAESLNGNSPNLLNKVIDPKFKHGECPAHPFTLKRRSPYVNAGLVEDWMATAVDLAGNPRVYGDGVDIGCYENCDPKDGLILLFR